MQKAEFWQERLELLRHPEGGWFRETWRTAESLPFSDGAPCTSPRSYATAIYYLLEAGDRSTLHRIRSDELWLWHAGDPLRISVFPGGEGTPSSFTLGPDPLSGNELQGVVAAGDWFGAAPPSPGLSGYTLVSCVVAPGFEFRDFAFAKREELIARFPLHRGIIENLT
ncbi:cupin domain-containing protein [Chlorobium phaeovibrioides]|uniref:Cupin domain-containing protein n=1 Tax=Chlorobium phaeovibrioides TaxID=1094 RepID=A0ABW9UP79_CHLPH|nr:cupin domain-containing protein [Chlorobium phaeovibrioides]MWV53901.1 cupin domain-containing protein [Chlorobium phaeovibrioides]QEQ56607.1 cupin domain-containing protein [Chlorobium phaeovibrioides]RTY35249.1 cupin domain-containing protein [Chlorobium phaeovibrioides]